MIPEFKLKNVIAPDYKPPATWEEFRDLERPARIIAARYFLRQAAIRLHDFGLRPDEISNAFDGVPPWVSHQLHEHKRELQELRKDWVCLDEDCGYRGLKHEFFENLLDGAPMARCPECGLCNCEEYLEPPPPEAGVEPAPLGEVRELDQEIEPAFSFAGVDVPAQPGSCPVCFGMGEEGSIKDNHCERCNTDFCPDCLGIERAQLSRAYDAVQRCKCGGKDVG